MQIFFGERCFVQQMRGEEAVSSLKSQSISLLQEKNEVEKPIKVFLTNNLTGHFSTFEILEA